MTSAWGSMRQRDQKILVVDDDPVFLQSLSGVLEQDGYVVVTRESALGTRAAIMREKPNLVLLDYNMPDLRGEELVRLIRSNQALRDTAVLLISGAEDVRQLAENLGVKFALKGASVLSLLLAVQQALPRPRRVPGDKPGK